MSDGEPDSVRAIWFRIGEWGVAGKVYAGGTQGGAMSPSWDACWMTICEVCSVEDIAVEKFDIDDCWDNFFKGSGSSEKNPAFLVLPPSVIPLARCFGFGRAAWIWPMATDVKEEFGRLELIDEVRSVWDRGISLMDRLEDGIWII